MPAPLVVVVTTTPVSTLVTVTCTPGMTAFEGICHGALDFARV